MQDNQDRKKQVRMKYRVQENTKKKSDEDEIFRTRPDRLWNPPSLLYNATCLLRG